jgi:CheY-like chemotaxis protein
MPHSVEGPFDRRNGIRARADTPRTGARILVIDDEPLVGEMIVLALRRERVEAFVRPARALERLREVEFDLVLCDLLMPEMLGPDVHHAIAQTHPNLAARFVLMTGHAEDLWVMDFLAARRVPLLRKPFSAFDLEDSVAKVLGPCARAAI